MLRSDDPALQFDAILDCTGEASKCVGLLRGGGGLVSILAGPTATALRTWMEEAQLDPSTITCGVRPFLFSGCGSCLFETISGGRPLRRRCLARGATFAHVIGTGNGEIMGAVAELMAGGQVVAVVDREYPLDEALQAIEYQKAGRAAGKVVVTVA